MVLHRLDFVLVIFLVVLLVITIFGSLFTIQHQITITHPRLIHFSHPPQSISKLRTTETLKTTTTTPTATATVNQHQQSLSSVLLSSFFKRLLKHKSTEKLEGSASLQQPLRRSADSKASAAAAAAELPIYRLHTKTRKWTFLSRDSQRPKRIFATVVYPQLYSRKKFNPFYVRVEQYSMPLDKFFKRRTSKKSKRKSIDSTTQQRKSAGKRVASKRASLWRLEFRSDFDGSADFATASTNSSCVTVVYREMDHYRERRIIRIRSFCSLSKTDSDEIVHHDFDWPVEGSSMITAAEMVQINKTAFCLHYSREEDLYAFRTICRIPNEESVSINDTSAHHFTYTAGPFADRTVVYNDILAVHQLFPYHNNDSSTTHQRMLFGVKLVGAEALDSLAVHMDFYDGKNQTTNQETIDTIDPIDAARLEDLVVRINLLANYPLSEDENESAKESRELQLQKLKAEYNSLRNKVRDVADRNGWQRNKLYWKTRHLGKIRNILKLGRIYGDNSAAMFSKAITSQSADSLSVVISFIDGYIIIVDLHSAVSITPSTTATAAADHTTTNNSEEAFTIGSPTVKVVQLFQENHFAGVDGDSFTAFRANGRRKRYAHSDDVDGSFESGRGSSSSSSESGARQHSQQKKLQRLNRRGKFIQRSIISSRGSFIGVIRPYEVIVLEKIKKMPIINRFDGRQQREPNRDDKVDEFDWVAKYRTMLKKQWPKKRVLSAQFVDGPNDSDGVYLLVMYEEGILVSYDLRMAEIVPEDFFAPLLVFVQTKWKFLVGLCAVLGYFMWNEMSIRRRLNQRQHQPGGIVPNVIRPHQD